jgi:hypothetical protein
MIYKLINRGLTGDATKIRLPANLTPQQLIHGSALQTHGSRPFNPPVITDEASPFALRSTRNPSEDSNAPGCGRSETEQRTGANSAQLAWSTKSQNAQDGRPEECSRNHG